VKKVLTLIGTRPNFIKVTQFKKQAKKFNIDLTIINTGQHYDYKMSGVFFDQFSLKPDVFLEIPKGISSTEQIAEIMLRLGEYSARNGKPDILLVVGDVNSTLAGALYAHKSGIPLGHIESGLRSEDLRMPEEINRILTDRITDIFFVTEQSGFDNLINEGVDKAKIYFVGNTMIDTLVAFDQHISDSEILDNLHLEDEYVLMTMHRPATVDNEVGLKKLISIIQDLTSKLLVVLPLHPRTKLNFTKCNLLEELKNIKNLHLIDPLGYFEFQKLIKNSKIVITDSGGIQEESTFRQIPCLTLRPNTERPSTIHIGTNTLLDLDADKILEHVDLIMNNKYKKGLIPEMWDGNSTNRVFEILSKLM
jgi:UDP-N-acetylglucosamine 2-epimerase (non-hydrolysing)